MGTRSLFFRAVCLGVGAEYSDRRHFSGGRSDVPGSHAAHRLRRVLHETVKGKEGQYENCDLEVTESFKWHPAPDLQDPRVTRFTRGTRYSALWRR